MESCVCSKDGTTAKWVKASPSPVLRGFGKNIFALEDFTSEALLECLLIGKLLGSASHFIVRSLEEWTDTGWRAINVLPLIWDSRGSWYARLRTTGWREGIFY